MDTAHIVAVWLHTVAFVIAWGYYGILGRIVIPALGRALESGPRATTLMAIERRAVPLIGISLMLFTVTGSYLLVTDTRYAGVGNLGSGWAVLMVVKHLLVAVLVVLGVIVDRLIRRAAAAATEDARTSAWRRLALGADAATGLGALIVLLTVVARTVA